MGLRELEMFSNRILRYSKFFFLSHPRCSQAAFVTSEIQLKLIKAVSIVFVNIALSKSKSKKTLFLNSVMNLHRLSKIGIISRACSSGFPGAQPSSNMVNEQVKELNMPFAKAKTGPFFQEQPSLGNQFIEDVTLQNYLKRFMPSNVRICIKE